MTLQELDPYVELGVVLDDTPATIKRAYYKLCLKYHPDKLSEEERVKHKDKFERIQFSYSVLGDVDKRARYDATGSLEVSESDVNWTDIFRRESEQVTEEMIEKDKSEYQGSKDEYDDILDAFKYYEGAFAKLFEAIPHLEFSEDEEARVYEIVSTMVSQNEVSTTDAWKKYQKGRAKEVKRMKRQAAKESREAEVLQKQLDSTKSLKEMILAKKDDPFAALIAKYEGEEKSKKAKRSSKQTKKEKASKKHPYDIDEAEFARIQSGLKRQK